MCKSITVEEIPASNYDISYEIPDNYIVEYDIPLTYTFEYCISYRDPALNEWILARGIWNDEGIWTPDGIWNDY